MHSDEVRKGLFEALGEEMMKELLPQTGKDLNTSDGFHVGEDSFALIHLRLEQGKNWRSDPLRIESVRIHVGYLTSVRSQSFPELKTGSFNFKLIAQRFNERREQIASFRESVNG